MYDANCIFQCLCYECLLLAGILSALCGDDNVDGHDPISPGGFLDAVAASPRPKVGRDGVSGSEQLDEAGPSRPPVIVHGVSEAGND